MKLHFKLNLIRVLVFALSLVPTGYMLRSLLRGNAREQVGPLTGKPIWSTSLGAMRSCRLWRNTLANLPDDTSRRPFQDFISKLA